VNALERIVAATREEVARRRTVVPEAELARAGAERVQAGDFRPFLDLLRRPGLSVIAEHKRRSPSAGLIRDGVALADVVGAYERGGAAALSILTEGPSFGGSLDDLRAARVASALPILRKDFIVDPYQLHEALAAGADAVLLIVAALDERDLAGLHAQARALGLVPLVEVHDRAELEAAAALDTELIGINNRDLSTLEVDVRRTFGMLPFVPDGVSIVAESGFRSRPELDELEAAGVHGVLVGEALMRAVDIEAACRALAAPARSGRPPGTVPAGGVGAGGAG
jgi:indole-3-glycerol phosphate synthase